MSDDRIMAELHAAAASLATAKAAAEAGDWTAAEQGILDAQERCSRILPEVGLKLLSGFGVSEPPLPVKAE